MESTEIATKSEVAATRLRYEQQARNLQAEMSALQVRTLLVEYAF